MSADTLLMLGDHHGSLAAARCLGRHGVAVTFADHRRWLPAAWSRFVSRRIVSPEPTDLTAYAAWLVAQGEAAPGLFLYAASDDLCWVLSRHEAVLRRSFRMYQPGVAAIYTLLNKARLHALAATLDVPCPRTWTPESPEALEQVADDVRYPVLIKPRTQIGLRSKRKGQLCHSREELLTQYPAFRAQNRYHPELTAYDSTVDWPLVQEYLPSAATAIVSVAGFCDENGECVFRASQKVFQRPRTLGVGVGFESRPVPEALKARVRALCQGAGYYGIFEAEFITADDGRLLLADFNPRYYGQMQFEVARNLPLPWLAWLGAGGEREALTAALRSAVQGNDGPGGQVIRYAHGWLMTLLVTTQWIGGRLAGTERRSWLSWLRGPGVRVNALHDPDDPVPYWLDLVGNWASFARHPRDFVRKFCLDA